MRRILVTGAGFIGCYLVRQLLDAGDTVLLLGGRSSELLRELVGSTEGWRHEAGDVSDTATVFDAVQSWRPDAIVHLASLLAAASSARPHMALKVNCLGTLNVFDAARLFQIPRVVWASSSSVFGAPEDYREETLDDGAPHFPKNLYGACKSFCEHASREYRLRHRLDVVGLRVTMTLGRGVARGGSGNLHLNLVERPARGEPSVVPYGDDAVPFVHVTDVARAFVDVLARPGLPRTVYNLGGEVRPIREAAEYVRQKTGVTLTVASGSYGHAWRFDTSALTREAGYRPRFATMEQVLDQCFADAANGGAR